MAPKKMDIGKYLECTLLYYIEHLILVDADGGRYLRHRLPWVVRMGRREGGTPHLVLREGRRNGWSLGGSGRR